MPSPKLTAALLLLAPLAAFARSDGEGQPPEPPPEAYTACASSAASDACAVKRSDRTVAGTCAADADGALFCRPAHPPHRGPPPEAYAACRERTQAASCTVELPGGEKLAGQCVADQQGDRQFCLPNDLPAPPQG